MRGLCLYAQNEAATSQSFQGWEKLLTMQKTQRWRELCALAAVEQDREKLMAYVAEISRLFDEEQAIREANPDSSSADPSAAEGG
jgi:hypothetical protein